MSEIQRQMLHACVELQLLLGAEAQMRIEDDLKRNSPPGRRAWLEEQRAEITRLRGALGAALKLDRAADGR